MIGYPIQSILHIDEAVNWVGLHVDISGCGVTDIWVRIGLPWYGTPSG